MILIISIILLFSSHIHHDAFDQLVVWNIGQGQWVTLSKEKTCFHFDVGGEYFNSQKISSLCGHKENFVFFSHWDWDHIGLTRKLQKSIPQLCIAQAPQGTAQAYKTRLLHRIPSCDHHVPSRKDFRKLHWSAPTHTLSENDLSWIYTYQNQILIPGDSTQKMESIWAKQLPKTISLLIAGHHGSKTSSSETLLKSTPMLRQAIVSARKAVYGHPHAAVMERFKKYGIAVLKTEDWGNIRIYLFAGMK